MSEESQLHPFLAACALICLFGFGVGLATYPRYQVCRSYFVSSSGHLNTEIRAVGPATSLGSKTDKMALTAQQCENETSNYGWLSIQMPSSAAWQAIFDGILVGIGLLQWKIYSRIRADSVAFNQPFVAISHIDKRFLHHPDDRQRIMSWKFVPMLENSGNLAATNLIDWVSYQLFSDELPEGFDFPDLGNSRNLQSVFIRPHGHIEGPSAEFTIHELVAVKKGRAHAYIWGWVEYSDRISKGRVHKIEFCNKLIVSGDPKSSDCIFSFPFHKEHNAEGVYCQREVGMPAPLRPPDAFKVQFFDHEVGEYGFSADDPNLSWNVQDGKHDHKLDKPKC